MGKAVSSDDTFSRSFMCLGFVAAGLIIAVQWGDFSADPVASSASSTPIATLPTEPNSDASTTPSNGENSESENPIVKGLTSNPNSTTPSGIARSGLASALEGVIEPMLLLDGSKLIIDLSDRQIYLFQDSALTANYEIAVGRSGWETPTGEFKVINMYVDPIWQHPFTGEVVPPGSGNPLGTRWIGFWTDGEHQIGLHGTNQEDLIGQAVSHGCIRLRETDIQALYEHVTVDMPVVVRP